MSAERVAAALAAAMRAEDPVAALAAASRDLPELRGVDADGVRVAAMLVAKLRFERLVNGSADAGAWFEMDPRGFVAAFRRYHREVAPTAYFPQEEARLWAAWRASAR